jgi:cytochrome c oxidase subunit 2
MEPNLPSWIPFWLPSDTQHGKAVDLLFAGLVITSLLVLGLLSVLLLRFAIHYRAGNRNANRDHRIRKSWHWEVTWTALTMLGFFGLFVWAAQLYLKLYEPPADALVVYVVAQQWMWKVQHEGGQREINELHVPAGRAVRLVMSSQDVIHSFFVPAFRIKRDVLPGRFETIWFRPRLAGTFHLFCAEYCGTDHARMLGQVIVMSPPDFERWLTEQGTSETLAAEGAALFRQFGCSGCHGQGGAVRAPPLEGLYGRPVPLSNGTTDVADDRYIRDSILQPRAEIAAGYQPLMPSFAGKITEDELVLIVAYIKSLADRRPTR